MKSDNFIKAIKYYASLSFLIPLIAINSCLLIYKFFGDYDLYYPLDWDNQKITYPYKEYVKLNEDEHGANKNRSFTNCPKFIHEPVYVTKDNIFIKNEAVKLKKSNIEKNNIKEVILERQNVLNPRCVKNSKFIYFLLTNIHPLEKLLVKSQIENTSGFSKIKNPYFYGEASISRTARFFPAIVIFKTLIILSSILLFIYWKNNLSLFNELKNKNVLANFSNSFFYLGVLSCIFLFFHAVFLGLDFDSKIFDRIRKLVIILFIVFEVAAQISLTNNLFKLKRALTSYIKISVLKAKIVFVSIVFLVTCVSFVILAFYDPSSAFKHTLEWNYFAFLLFYYLLSSLLWKNKTTFIHP